MDYWFVVTEESLVANSAPLVAENEIGRGRDRTGAVASGYGIAGGLGGYGRAEDLGKLCQMALSDTVPTPGGGGIITFAPTNYLDFWTVEKNVGDTLYVWLVNGKINTLTITVAANAIATWTTDWVISMEKTFSVADVSTPSYSDNDLLAFHGGLIQIGGGATPTTYSNMESIGITINNGLSNDEYTVQPSRFLNDITEGARTIDLEFSQVFQTAADYSTYTYGTLGRTTPGYALYETDVYFLLMNAQSKVSATEYIEFDFPRVMFGGLPISLANGRIVVANTGTVLAPAVGDIMTVTYLP
jgi:hypothetical protein